MFKKIFLVLIISINLFIFADKVSDSLIDEYIKDKSKPVEFIELKESGYSPVKVVTFITNEQLSEDIKILKYILNYAYSGKDYWSKNGVDFELMYKKLEDLNGSKINEIAVSNIENILVESLKNIVDTHFTIYGKNLNRFFKHKNVYFADILIEKRDNNYFVIRSKQNNIKVGMKFDDSEDLLFRTLSPKGNEHFLIGKLSFEKTIKLNIKFDNKNYELKLHTCKLNEAYFKDDKAFYLEEKENIPIIQVTNFDPKYNTELSKYADYGKELKNSQYFILNLYNNHGGDSRYPMDFIENINNSEISAEGIYAELISPATLQGQVYRYQSIKNSPSQWIERIKRVNNLMNEQKNNPKYFWQITDNYNKNNVTGSYNGTAIILINREVGSSGESAITFSRCLKNCILIGENSAGGGTFGDICLYILPNSKITLQLPYKLTLIKGFYEGIGFIPDYWLDSKNPINEIINWIKKPEEYIFELK